MAVMRRGWLLVALAACGTPSPGAPAPATDAARDAAPDAVGDTTRASCTDQLRDGDETDVDCGGSCGACVAGEHCSLAADCAGHACSAGTCGYPLSCADLQVQAPGVGSGQYTIYPLAAQAPFVAYCDMSRDGGGWTLIWRSNGDATFEYDATLWTSATLMDDGNPQPTMGNAKYPGFTTLPVTVLRGELAYGGQDDRFTYAGDGAHTAVEMFTAGEQKTAGFPMAGTSAYWYEEPNCRYYGLDLHLSEDPPYSNGSAGRVRFGWTANDENDCSSNDTAIGLGLHQSYNGVDRGAGFCTSGPDENITTNGYLWVK
jgi:hypothetical protein